MLENLALGFKAAQDPSLLLVAFLAVTGGLVIGSLPGLTATMGVAILVPLTFQLPPEHGLLILMSIFISAVQGGSIPAILMKTPGTPASAVTCFDGYPLAKQGMAGRAIGMAQLSSFVGLFISWIILITAAPIIAKIALKFGPPDYFAIAVFGLTMVITLSTDSILKGLIAGLFGLLIATIGIDPIHGVPRLNFGSNYLLGGVSYVPALIGLFAISEVIVGVEDIGIISSIMQKTKRVIPSLPDIKKSLPTMIRSGILGTLLGSLPGVGADISSFICYGEAKRWSKEKDLFGKGNIEGIAAAEAGNNAVCGGALIPMLTLGVPGDAVTAIVLGSLIIWGLRPGSQLFVENADLVYTLFAGFLVASVLTLIIGLSLAKLFAKLLVIPRKYLLPVILSFCIVGTYAINNSLQDVFVAVIFGILGYFMTKSGFQGSPIVLALILGPMVESNFRRSLVLSHGSYAIFYTSPICLAFLIISILSVILSIRMSKKQKDLIT